MKKLILTILTITLVALAIGLEAPPARARANWVQHVLADSAAAETSADYYVTTGHYTKGFRVWAYIENNPTGASDQVWIFMGRHRLQPSGTAKHIPFYLWLNSATTATATGAFGTSDVYFHVCPQIHGASGAVGTIGKVCLGDSLKIQYLKQNVTGGDYSLVVWIQAVE
jgi:hypothetical protein